MMFANQKTELFCYFIFTLRRTNWFYAALDRKVEFTKKNLTKFCISIKQIFWLFRARLQLYIIFGFEHDLVGPLTTLCDNIFSDWESLSF